MWNVALEKRKIVWFFSFEKYVVNSDENLIKGVPETAAINTEDTATTGEFKESRKRKNLNKNDAKRKLMGRSSGKY